MTIFSSVVHTSQISCPTIVGNYDNMATLVFSFNKMSENYAFVVATTP